MTIDELIQLRDQVRHLQQEMEGAEGDTKTLAAQSVESEFNAAMSRLETLRRQFTATESHYQQQLEQLVSNLDRDVPIALLPVRLETRFAGSELWLRIYPDDLHQNSHQPGLTADEVVWGKQFWEQSWRAGKQAAFRPHRLQAWIQLASRFGPARAAWIARSLKPKNHDRRPDDPVAKDKTLTPAPDFPTPPPTSGAYHTKVLPDRWLAIAYMPGQKIVQWGNLIPHPLEMNFSSGNSWMVDFEEAVKIGMGMRIPLPGRETEVNLLLVLGVKGTQDSDQSAALLRALFDAHHYTWGLDLAPVGTPTNNTEEVKSGYAGRDPDFESSFATEIENALDAPSDLWDGLKAARALGLEYAPPFVFAQVQHANTADQIEARYMQNVLWPATWGYFLTQLMNEPKQPIFHENSLDEWRKYYAEQVRARGPLPTLRIGDQPYGLLPVTVTSPERFVPTARGEGPVPAAVLIYWLNALRGLWQNALQSVPRFNQTQTFRDHVDPGQNLLAMLSMNAVSASYHGRSALGPRYTENLWWLLNQPIPAEWSRQLDDMTNPILNKYGLPTQMFLNQVTFAANTFPLSLPLVQENPVSETETLENNYIAWLSKATPLQIHDQDYARGQAAPKTLLYFLLRHATLQAYADAALRLRKERIPSEPELVDLWDLAGDPTSSKTQTSWRYLHFGPRLDGSDQPDQELLDLLSQDPASDSVPVKHLREFLNQLRHLSKLPTARLERLLVESLDLSSYRLDAWITSCATHRLQEMRRNAPSGIRIGGYGWVENLRPRSKAAERSAGYVHTPSLSQAATAAVLRCGYLSHSTDPSYQALALDLSSRRVRLAGWLLDGVRNNQPLGALLGYRFERGLHENHPGLELDKYIASFRELAPLAAGRQIPKEEGQSLESIAANNVVDGLALRNRWKKGKEKNQWDLTTIPFVGNKKFPSNSDAATEQDYRAVEAELNALEDAVDAISDVLLAESVHQAVQGNPLRSGASLDALSRHETPPQELDIIRTPRTGIALTQRLLVLFDGAAVPAYPAAWMPTGTAEERIHKIARQARAAAEPRLNAWVGKLIGNPAKVSCKVEYLHPTTDEVLTPVKEIKLSDLNLSPLDILYAAPLGEQAQRSDLEQWIIYHALRNRPDGIPANAGIRILYNQTARTAGELSFPELLEIARATRELVLGARALEQRDLYQPGQDVPSSVARDERLEKAVERLKHILNDLIKLLNLPSTDNLSPKDFDSASLQAADLDELRETLLDFVYFGLPGAVPLSLAGDTAADQTTLLNQAIRLGRETTERLARISNIIDPQAKWDEVFGGGFRVLPSFDIPEGMSADFSKRKNDDNPASAEVVQWFQRIARVRDGAGRLDLALMYAGAIGAGNSFDF